MLISKSSSHIPSHVKDHDTEAEAIATQGKLYIEQHLGMHNVTSYWRELLTAYTRLMTWTPVAEEKGYVILR